MLLLRYYKISLFKYSQSNNDHSYNSNSYLKTLGFMTENTTQYPRQSSSEQSTVPPPSKKKAVGWGINPLMPCLPQHVALAINQSKALSPLLNSVPPQPTQPQRIVKKLDIYDLYLDQKLGSGYTSDVYLGTNTKTGQPVCIKVIDYLGLKTPGEKKMIESQILCLRTVNNPFILQCYDILESKEFCYIITEVCNGGDLYRQLHLKNSFDESEAMIVFKQLISALLELKNKGVVHRDIKPENVFLKDGEVRLADFGFAIKSQLIQTQEALNLGSPLYMSPQTLLENKYSFASDIFSLGITIYELIHKTTPWETHSEEELKKKIVTEDVLFKQGLSEELKELLRRCLERDVSKRITIQEIIQTPLIKLKK